MNNFFLKKLKFCFIFKKLHNFPTPKHSNQNFNKNNYYCENIAKIKYTLYSFQPFF